MMVQWIDPQLTLISNEHILHIMISLKRVSKHVIRKRILSRVNCGDIEATSGLVEVHVSHIALPNGWAEVRIAGRIDGVIVAVEWWDGWISASLSAVAVFVAVRHKIVNARLEAVLMSVDDFRDYFECFVGDMIVVTQSTQPADKLLEAFRNFVVIVLGIRTAVGHLEQEYPIEI